MLLVVVEQGTGQQHAVQRRGGDGLADRGGEGVRMGGMTLIEFVRYGSTVGYTIILVSIVCLGMSIERGFALRRDNIIPPDASPHDSITEVMSGTGAARACRTHRE